MTTETTMSSSGHFRETNEEILPVLRAHEFDMSTISQYLQSSGVHMLVRSSYHADQQAHAVGVF